jgi:glucose-6-phosphate 1-epimerase
VNSDIAASLDVLNLRNAQIHLRAASTVFTEVNGYSELSSESADLPVLECISETCRAVISLQGAQILSFRPSGKDELLWLSPLSSFRVGDVIRGGIPLCLPWFGVNRRQVDLAKHGFARTQLWTLDDVQQAEDDKITLQFGFSPTKDDLAVFLFPFRAQLDVTLGDELHLKLSIINQGRETMPLSFALHTYFAVGDLGRVKIDGLSGSAYLDNCQGLAKFVQSDPLVFDKEIDRVYEGLGGSQSILDAGRRIDIGGVGCDTVVVWNPGAELAGKMADVGSHYLDYLCVERGMAFDDEQLLAAGGVTVAEMTLSSI